MKVYVVCTVWDWENEEVDKVFSTREKAVNYIADKIIEYKDEDDDEEIMENTLDEIKAKLQKNLRAYPSYYRGYEEELE